LSDAAIPIEVADRDPAAAVARLRSLHDGESVLPAVVGLGPVVRAPLAALLHEREPSGIYQPRCLAARALGLLHADDALLDFLRQPRFPDSPVERAGEEAVVNAAARALGRHRPERALDLLIEIGCQRPHLDGVIEALAGYVRAEAIPALVEALAEDVSRPQAEEGLRAIGAPGRPLLLAVAYDRDPDTETHRRQRHGALSVLLDIGTPDGAAPALHALISDPDDSIAAAACGVVLRFGQAGLRRRAGQRLVELERPATLRLAIEIAAIRNRLTETMT
jgi:HEAT repeat protein